MFAASIDNAVGLVIGAGLVVLFVVGLILPEKF
jgi:hypothetical protein